MSKATTTTKDEAPPRCRCGHPKDGTHYDRVRVNLPTLAEDWHEAIRLGYVSERRRWNGRERRGYR